MGQTAWATNGDQGSLTIRGCNDAHPSVPASGQIEGAVPAAHRQEQARFRRSVTQESVGQRASSGPARDRSFGICTLDDEKHHLGRVWFVDNTPTLTLLLDAARGQTAVAISHSERLPWRDRQHVGDDRGALGIRRVPLGAPPSTCSVVHAVLATGGEYAGMSGGCEWPRHQLTDGEYMQLRIDLLAAGEVVDMDAPGWVITPDDFPVWRVTSKVGCSPEAVRAWQNELRTANGGDRLTSLHTHRNQWLHDFDAAAE